MKRLSLSTNATLVMILVLVAAGMAAGTATAAQNATDANETVSAENATDGENVTIENVGENVTIGPVQGVTPEEPTVYLGPNVTMNDSQVTVSQQYYMGGEVAGWQGAAPESINGTTNPTLNLTAGETYAITWVNIDGLQHNVVIEDQQNNTVAETPIITGEGGAQTLVFQVPDEPGTYYCEVHPTSMRGDITLEMNATANATA